MANLLKYCQSLLRIIWISFVEKKQYKLKQTKPNKFLLRDQMYWDPFDIANIKKCIFYF